MKLLRLVWILPLLALPVAAQAQFEFTTNADGSPVTIIGYNGPGVAVVIPSSSNDYAITGIAQSAFYESGLTHVSIPDSITNIGDGAFFRCFALAGFTVSSNNPAYGSLSGVLFDKAQDVLIQYPEASTRRTYTVPSGVTRIEEDAFYECGLTSVSIPDSVTNIGEGAFYWGELTSVAVPGSVISIGEGAFVDCPVTNFSVDATNPAYSSLDDVLFDKARDVLIQYPAGLTNRDYTIPVSVTSIGEEAFSGCYLTSVSIPGGVTNIADQAFFDCNLTNVTLPNTVTSVGDEAFAYCFGLTQINIPDSITNIGDGAFSGCDLTSVSIPGSVTHIGDYAFIDCFALTNFSVDAGNRDYSSLNGVLFDKAQDVLIQFPIGLTNQAYNIPDSVGSIGDFAFGECAGLTGITIPSGVVGIGTEAFLGCSDLTNISIPGSVTSIGVGAFADCYGLTSVSIPDGVMNIASNTFAECSGLTNISIPSSVASIGKRAFADCYSLTHFTIPDGVASIGENAFYSCTGLTSFTIPSNVTNIVAGAFFGCPVTNFSVDTGNTAYSSLNGVLFDKAQHLLIEYPVGLSNHAYTIPSSVTRIGDNAFYGCSLTSVTIPANLTAIGDNAFDYCSSLITAYFLGNAPPDDGTVFLDDDFAIVFYLAGTTGWGASFGGVTTRLRYLPSPEVLTYEPSLGVRSNQFGFTISGAGSEAVVVHAATDLNSPVWVPIATNSLLQGTLYFSDPDWTNYPVRFYRLTAQ